MLNNNGLVTSSSPSWPTPYGRCHLCPAIIKLTVFLSSQKFLQTSYMIYTVPFNEMVIDNLNITQTSYTPENGCRKVALSSFPMKDMADPSQSQGSGSGPGASRPGKWKLEAVPEKQGSKRKRDMEENDDTEWEQKEMGANLKCFNYGFVSMIGRRREMEDAVAVAVEMGLPPAAEGGEGVTKEYDFFGVYDGHGGSQVANACKERLHKLLVETAVVEGGGGGGGGEMIGWEKAMMESFQKMDDEVMSAGPAVASVGSTAVVAVVGEKEVVVANCGDSRAVLSRDGAVVPLSIDHKPNRADELERIELLGGKVIDWNGHRVLGVLSTSRSIGDEYLKPYVIPVPQITISDRTKGDEFLILASDGLWDVITNDVACQIVRRCLKGHVKRRPPFKIPAVAAEMPAILTKNDGVAAEAASILAELAIARGSTDNISVIVIQLKEMKTSSSSRSVRTVVGQSGGTVVGQSSGTVH